MTPAEPVPPAAGDTEGRKDANEQAQTISAREAMQAIAAQLDRWADHIALRRRYRAGPWVVIPSGFNHCSA